MVGPTNSRPMISVLRQAGLVERRLDVARALLQREALLAAGHLRQPDHDLVGAGGAVLLDDLFAWQRRQGASHGVFGHRLAELGDDQRAAGKVDAERQALGEDHADAGEDHHERQRDGVPPPPDEVEVRVGEDLHVCRRPRC